MTRSELFKKIPADYIYSVNGRDNILVRDVLSYLQYHYGLQINSLDVKEAIRQQGFEPRGHVSIRFKDSDEPTSTRAWSRINPKVEDAVVDRQRIYTKEEIVTKHVNKILDYIKTLKDTSSKDVFVRDSNALISEAFIRKYIVKEYKNIKSKEVTELIKEVTRNAISTRVQLYNSESVRKSRYWKIYLFSINKPVENPETDAVYIMYDVINGSKGELSTYVSLIKYVFEGSIYTITLRGQDINVLKDRTNTIAHVVNEISRKEDYKFREGVYNSDRYVNSKKGGALDEDLFKNDINLFTY